MKRKTKFLASTMLLLALLLTIPALAATTDGYTEVSTAEELVSALTGDTAKIRLTNDISTVNYTDGPQGGRYIISRNLELDLNGFTWTAGEPQNSSNLITINAGDTAPTVKIVQGTISVGSGNYTVIRHNSGNLKLLGVTMNGRLALGAATTTSIVESHINRTAPNPDGSSLSGDYSAIQFLTSWDAAEYAKITEISNSTITGYYLGINASFCTIDSIVNSRIEGIMGSGISLTTYNDQSTPSSIGEILDSTIVGGGSEAAIRMGGSYSNDESASTIGTIGNCGITGGIRGGTADYIYLLPGNNIDSIADVTITGGSNGLGISNRGTIGTISDCHISTEIVAIGNNGTINAITDTILLANGTYGKSIENGSGATIGTISGCTLTATQSSLHNHPTASIRTVTGNTINTPIANGGTITSLSGNTFTIPESGAIDNNSWGEDKQGTVTTCENNTFAAANYTMKFARQIRLYEPWGVRVSMMVDLNGSAFALQNNSNVKSVGIYFLQGGTAPSQEDVAVSGTLITGEFNEALSSSQDVYSSDFVGIQTSKLAETIYYMGVLTLADGTTVYSDVREMSVLELLQAGVSNASMSTEEKNVYQAIINWYDAYQTYLNN